MLEECGLPYTPLPVDITGKEQFAPDFLRISPNNKIPAIVDSLGPDGEPVSVFESCAILLYLADKTGKLMPTQRRARMQVMQWLMFQVGTVGPMLGQAHHFRQHAPENIPYAIERYTKEANRIYSVLERRIESTGYVAGNEYTIADIAVFPWLRHWERQGISWDEFPSLRAWFDLIAARVPVQRGLNVLNHLRIEPQHNPTAAGPAVPA